MLIISFAVGLVLAKIGQEGCYNANRAFYEMIDRKIPAPALDDKKCCGSNGIICTTDMNGHQNIVSIDWSSKNLVGKVSLKLALLRNLEVL